MVLFMKSNYPSGLFTRMNKINLRIFEFYSPLYLINHNYLTLQIITRQIIKISHIYKFQILN